MTQRNVIQFPRNVSESTRSRQFAASRAQMLKAWEVWERAQDVKQPWKVQSKLALRRECVRLMRDAASMTEHHPLAPEGLVSMLDSLADELLTHADDDPGYIAEALAVASEAVHLQAAIVIAHVANPGISPSAASEAVDVLGTVVFTHGQAQEAAGQTHVRTQPAN